MRTNTLELYDSYEEKIGEIYITHFENEDDNGNVDRIVLKLNNFIGDISINPIVPFDTIHNVKKHLSDILIRHEDSLIYTKGFHDLSDSEIDVIITSKVVKETYHPDSDDGSKSNYKTISGIIELHLPCNVILKFDVKSAKWLND